MTLVIMRVKMLPHNGDREGYSWYSDDSLGPLLVVAFSIGLSLVSHTRKLSLLWAQIHISTPTYMNVTIHIHCCCVTSVVSDSVQPHRQQSIRLPSPWDSPGKNTGVGCHFLLQCVKVKSLSHVQLFTTPMGCSLPGSSVHGIF